MKIALIIPESGPKYSMGLYEALNSHGHSAYILSADRTFPEDGRRIGSKIEDKWDRLKFSLEVHRWAIKNGPHVIEASHVGYPLLVEQLAGGTPTVIRYDPALSILDFDQSLHDNGTNTALEMLTVRGANRVVTSSESVRRNSSMIGPAELLPLGIVNPGTHVEIPGGEAPSEGSFILYCPESAFAYCSSIAERLGVQVELLSSFELITDFDRFWNVRGVGVLSDSFDESRIASIISRGCPVVHLNVGPDYAEWPVIWVGSLDGDLIRRLQSSLKLLDKKPSFRSEVREFSKKYYWSNLVGQYVSVYQAAVKDAWEKGRVRGW